MLRGKVQKRNRHAARRTPRAQPWSTTDAYAFASRFGDLSYEAGAPLRGLGVYETGAPASLCLVSQGLQAQAVLRRNCNLGPWGPGAGQKHFGLGAFGFGCVPEATVRFR